jgi:ATP-binding cassette, subfamily B, multidrug efflux pump
MSRWSRLFQYGKLYKKQILWGLTFLLIAVATDLVGPLIISYLIDHHMKPGSIEAKPIVILLAVFFGFAILSAIFRFCMTLTLQSGANRVVQKMRQDVFGHIQKLPVNYFDTLPAGKIVARVTNDTEAVRNLYVTVLSNFAMSIVSVLGAYLMLFYLNWQIGAVALILVPILYVWMILYRKYSSTYNHIVRTKIADINAMINESINGMTIIQAFRREEQMKNEFDEMNNEHYENNRKLLVLDASTQHNLIGILRLGAFLAFILFFGTKSMETMDYVTAGTLYALVDYLTRLFNPMINIVNQFSQMERSLIAADRIFEVLNIEGEDVSKDRIPRYEGNVTFDNVSFAYKNDEYVLKNLQFEANKGETIALVGHTGSGKSSIMNLLFRFYDPQKGRILIDGQDITKLSRQAIREHMGIVLQDPYLFTGTVATNVSLNDPRVSQEQVEAAIKAVGGDDVLKHLPGGINEPVIEKGSTLSSGQRQIISFARALAFDPAILILDEATSNIDTETEEVIQHAMDVLKQGRTTFIIAHRLSTIKNADKILVLDRGEIVEMGTHDELIALGGRYETMYRLQANALA